MQTSEKVRQKTHHVIGVSVLVTVSKIWDRFGPFIMDHNV